MKGFDIGDAPSLAVSGERPGANIFVPRAVMMSNSSAHTLPDRDLLHGVTPDGP